MNFLLTANDFFANQNIFLFLFIFLSGIFFSFLNFYKKNFFDFLQPILFLIFGFYALKINIFSDYDFINGAMISGISLSFFISSLMNLREKNLKKLDFLVFSYFGLVIFLFLKLSSNLNLFHLFLIFELLTIIGFIFILVDYSTSQFDLKTTTDLLEKQNSKKNIGMRYFIAHCFSGLLFMVGIGIMNTQGYSILISDLFSGKTPMNYFILFALLINTAVPFFSFWFVQSYSAVRFSFSVIMMAGVSKISIFLLYYFAQSNYIPYLDYLGIATMVYGSLLTLQETNIRRFFCYALISHNGFLLLAISQKISLTLFTELIIISFVLQSLFASLIFMVSYKAKDYYFSEIEKSISKYKFLFILSVITNWLFISMPFSVSFVSKAQVISAIDDNLIKKMIYFVSAINIFSHIFVFNYRVFTRKTLIFNKNCSFSDNMKNTMIFFVAFVPIILLYCFVYKSAAVPNDIEIFKYSKFLFLSLISFLILRRFFTKNQLFPYDITILFEYFKKFLNFIFQWFKRIEHNVEVFCKVVWLRALKAPSLKSYLNSYQFAFFFLFIYLFILIFQIIF